MTPMIALVVAPQQPGALPCVAMFTRRVKLHVGVRSWCGKEYDGGDGVYQMPATAQFCRDCAAAIAEFERKIGVPK